MASSNHGYRVRMSTLELTRRWASDLEKIEALRGERRLARSRVARKTGVAPGLLENLSRGRLKFWRPVMDGIRSAFIEELQKEITRMNHELHIALQSGARPHSDEVVEAQTLLNRAKDLLKRAGE